MTNWPHRRVIIPSHHRADLVGEKTLAFLDRVAWPHERITILVADEKQAAEYREIHPTIEVLVSALGLVQSRQWAIDNLLAEGEEMLWMDDDITDIVRALPGAELSGEHSLEPVGMSQFMSLVDHGFAAARVNDAWLWGIYPTANGYFMKHDMKVGLLHIVGAFYGQVIRRDAGLHLWYGDAKEDYERSLRHYEKDGAVVRLERFAVKTTYYRVKGGIEHRTVETVEKNVQGLLCEWPSLVSRNPRRRSNYPEIKLVNPRMERVVL